MLSALALIGGFASARFHAHAESAPGTPGLDLGAIDRKVDPCVDFYTYACGGWMRKNPIPPDRGSWGVYGKLQEENTAFLRAILERPLAADADLERRKIADFYAACIDEKTIERLGASPLKPDLERIARLSAKADLVDYLAAAHPRDRLSELGDMSFFAIGANQDFKNAAEYVAYVDQSGIGLPDRDYYFKEDGETARLRAAYEAHVARMLALIGVAPGEAKRQAGVVLRIEKALAAGSLTLLERRDPAALDHRMTIAELKALAPSFDWARYFARVGLEVAPPPAKALNVVAPKFFAALDKVLREEKLDDLKIYLRWHLVHGLAPYLSAAFVSENFSFYLRTRTGAEAPAPRWKRCVEYTDQSLGEALGKAFVEARFGAKEKARTLDMVRHIQAQMAKRLAGVAWMSAATKREAQEKLARMANKIGYPDKWRDYGAVEVARGDWVGDIARAQVFEFRRRLGKIGRPLDRSEWGMTPPTVNAYYDPQMNDMNFPAGILQPPLYDPKIDDAPNYGDTGATIGHELTHGFDDEGRKFDAAGDLRDWWTREDSQAFDKQAQCLVEQYSGYTAVDDVKVNGKLTLGENVADLGGTILAYLAWRDLTRGAKLAPIDGFSPAQRFFIGYAQSWCTSERPETARLRAATNPHAPPRYRTNGVVANMPEFAEAFGCKGFGPMVRQDICRVW